MSVYDLNGRQKDIVVAQTMRRDAALNLNGLYSFPRAPDADRLTDALRIVTDHFAALRSIIGFRKGDMVATLLEEPARIVSIDAGSSRAQFDLVHELAGKPFDLFTERPVRIYLLKGEGAIRHMFLQFHHVATDWWSFRVIHQSLDMLYENPGNARLRKDLLTMYNSRSLPKEHAQDSLDFWQDCLTRPVCIRRSDELAVLASHKEYSVPISFSEIEQAAQHQHMTPFELLFLKFAEAITFQINDDVFINTPVGNRSNANDAQTVGYLMNVVPVRCQTIGGRFDSDSTLKNLRNAIKHGCVPRSQLARIIESRHGTHAPLFDIVFMFLRDSIGGLHMPGGAVFTRVYPRKDEDRLVLTLRELSGKLTLVLEGDPADPIGARAVETYLQTLGGI